MNPINEKVLSIVRGVREKLLPFYGNIEMSRQKDGSANNAVTRLDEEVERYLSEKLLEIDPEAAFVGEEFGGDRNAKRLWIADPIDGTGYFIRGLPLCTTMLALIESGKVNFSVIYDFVNDIAYYAERGKGAYKNGERIKVSTRSINNAYVGWETRLDKKENVEILLKLREKVVPSDLICAGWELAMVASGRLEGRVAFDPHGNDYDFAPGSLLVEEAGGKVANIGKNDYDYKNVNFIAANPNVYEALTSGEDAIFPIIG